MLVQFLNIMTNSSKFLLGSWITRYCEAGDQGNRNRRQEIPKRQCKDNIEAILKKIALFFTNPHFTCGYCHCIKNLLHFIQSFLFTISILKKKQLLLV